MQIRSQRDFWAGVMFLVIGLTFVVLSQQYQMGTAAKMGPGYFPTMLGALMAILGAMLCVGGVRKSAPKDLVTRFGWREIGLVLGAVILFGILLPQLGMVISLAVLIGVAALASHEFNVRDTLISIVVLIAIAYAAFVYGLELQFPVWPKFLTN